MRRVATLAVVWLALSGCSVNEGDIENWKHTQRGPRKITTILVQSSYSQPLRVRAARALIEMRQHPNANGLDLLRGGMHSMPAADREAIVHELLPELWAMMGAGATEDGGAPGGAPGGAQGGAPGGALPGPTEVQIRAKDAAYVLLLGDGPEVSFANAVDRASLSNHLLDWILADFNTRALAGAYTAEQIVGAIGASAADRLSQAITSSDTMIPVLVDITRLINGVATPTGKSAAAERLIAVARELDSAPRTQRLDVMVRAMMASGGRTVTQQAVTSNVEFFKNRYFTVVFEALKLLAQPNGTTYLLQYAATTTAPLERRKVALTAVTNAVDASHTNALLALARCVPTPTPTPANQAVTCDMEIRGIAVDRIGETHNHDVVPTLFTLFDENNGTTADQGYVVRWKIGEAILRLGNAAILPTFMQHLGAPRPPTFTGYTFVEINGEAQAISDMNPTPREAMRAFVAANNAVPVRVLAMMFLGFKGETADLQTLQGFGADTTPVPGEGWTDVSLTTVGAVARHAREGLQNTMRQGQAAAPRP